MLWSYPTKMYDVYVPEDKGVGAHKLVPVEEPFLSADAVQEPVIRDTSGDHGRVPHAQVLPVGELLLVRGSDVQFQFVGGLLFEVSEAVHAAQSGVARQVGHPVHQRLRRRVLEVEVLHATLVAYHWGAQHSSVDECGQARHRHGRYQSPHRVSNQEYRKMGMLLRHHRHEVHKVIDIIFEAVYPERLRFG